MKYYYFTTRYYMILVEAKVKDLNLLESSINKAFASFDNKEFYEKLEYKICATTKRS